MRASRSASPSWVTACRCSTRRRGVRSGRPFMMERDMAEISLRKVVKQFKTVTAVDGLSLDIADGEFAVLLGPTGAGKTTTLRIVAGLEKPDQGEVWIDGRN